MADLSRRVPPEMRDELAAALTRLAGLHAVYGGGDLPALYDAIGALDEDDLRFTVLAAVVAGDLLHSQES